MPTETLNVSGLSASDSGQFSGSVTDIDETIAGADGSVMSSSANGEGETLRVALTNTSASITDDVVVTNVSVTIRGRATGGGNNDFDIDLYIGGTSQGTASAGGITGALANYSGINNAGWNSDWTKAQLDGAEILITCTQSGKAVNAQWEVDCLDVIITYSLGPDEHLTKYRFVIDNNPGSTTGFSHESATDFPFATGSSENSAFTPELDTTYCLICKVGNDGDTASGSVHQLQQNIDSGGWNDVNGTSTGARITDGSDDDTASSTTERLTTSTRTFGNSRYEDTVGNAAQTVGVDGENEYYYSIQFRSADLTGGEQVIFRVNNTTDGALVTNDVTPTANIAAAGATHSATMTGTGTPTTPTKEVGKKLSFTGTGSSQSILRPRVWLNNTQTKTGADELTVTSYNLTGTSITFSDPSGGKTGSLFLGVENLSNGEIGWIAVTVNAAAGNTHTATMTGTGGVALTIEVSKLLAGASTPVGSVTTVTSFLKTVEGSLAATGALLKQAQKQLAGSLTATGALTAIKTILKSLAGSLSATGELAVQVQKLFTGSLTATGALATATIFGKALAGSLTATGALLKQFQTTLSGSLTATGALTAIKTILKSLAGSLTATGELAVQVQKLFTGSLTATGALTTATTFLKALAGSLTATGALLKQFQTTLTGSSTWTGALSSTRVVLQSLAGSLAGSGALLKQAQITLTGSLTATGVVTSVITYVKALAGSLAGSGALLKQAQITITGSSTWTGIVTPIFQGAGAFFQEVGGSLTATGTLFKRIPQTLTGSMTTTGAVFKAMSQTFTGSVTAVGTLIEQATFGQAVSGSVTAVGNIFKQLQFTLAGVVTGTGALIKQARVTLSGSVTAAGNTIRDISYSVAGSLAASGALIEQLTANQAVAGSSTWTGILEGVILTPPVISGAVNAFRGYLGTFLGRQNRR